MGTAVDMNYPTGRGLQIVVYEVPRTNYDSGREGGGVFGHVSSSQTMALVSIRSQGGEALFSRIRRTKHKLIDSKGNRC